MSNVTRKDAEAVVQGLMTKYQWPVEFGPHIQEDFDGHEWVIAWEEGPEDWVYYLLEDDHVIECTGYVLKGQPMPEGVRKESLNHYSWALYPA